MKYIIIGLGNYGGVLAEELSVLGHEVIGVDTNEHRVDVLKDKIATSFIIDATDEQSLSVLPLKDVDVVRHELVKKIINAYDSFYKQHPEEIQE